MRFRPLVASLALFATFTVASHQSVQAAETEWRKAVSILGEPKYGDDFKHYDYVNPDAPKGGTLNQTAYGSFDSLNPFVVQGTPAAGLPATVGGGLLYDTLLSQSLDQPATNYGLIAEAIAYPDDYSSVKFRLNPAARWHDGQPITVDDVIWSFDTLKAQSPSYNKYYHDVTKAEKTGDHEVTFTFSSGGNRELPSIMGDFPILPKHWWEGNDASGKKRDISKPTTEIPLGSSAYKIESASPGNTIVWSRVADYWGKDLPVNVGRNNFDRIRYEYFRDQDAAWEGFKKGGFEDYRSEASIGKWMRGYDFPAFRRGEVVKAVFPLRSFGRMQGFLLNTRRDKFKDPRVREALTWAYDFESMSKNLFFGQYKRINSYFSGSELASSGLPMGKELEILETVKGDVPDEVFTKEFKLPVYATPQSQRDNLRQAVTLLRDAGYKQKNGKLVNAKTGEPFTIEFLANDPSADRTFGPYLGSLRKLGIDAELRVVDAAQYTARLNDFDFDMITPNVLAQSLSPGNEQRDFWGSGAADTPGSRNYMGIKNPAVDKLIDRIIFAKDRDELVAATHALDRVLLWNYYAVPQWYDDRIKIAYWNKFGMPAKQPDYAGIDPFSWWIDTAKEQALKARAE
ncbi:microcin C transport system substrate-binding protein [Phyllobacterium sp. YR620]|uniref:extracellular solute-binding protein n=1 Tax=Phyllobacterium sp. YR620 TaxID=1881066 RepID=UPI00088BD40E|nr:extracellular solute-binding protein [Phyllobacterium sp. YR620]SDP79160.1 microcin C transport system substrate-binding protein [Phyllobacterium sp. YR620]